MTQPLAHLTAARLASTIEKRERDLKRAESRVFQAAHPRGDVPFSECLKLASNQVRSQYEDAVSAYAQCESECRARFGPDVRMRLALDLLKNAKGKSRRARIPA